MICTPETLLKAAACFQCLSEKQLAAINSYLLCQILNTGGTGGGGSSFSGSGAPTTQVPSGNSGTYYDYTNNVNYQWNPVTMTWVLVGGGTPDSINYPGPPVVNPPALANIVVDVNGQQWQFYNGGPWI
jgi:hypothetical protein